MTIYQMLTLISVVLSLGLFIYTYKMGKVKNARIFSLLMLFITVFAIGSFFELVVRDLSNMLLWRNICQIGYILAVPTLLIMIIDYTGNERFLKPVNIAFVYAFPVLGLVLRWTDQYHHLMRKDIFLANGQLVIDSTPFGAVFMFFERAIVIAAVLMLITFYKRTNPRYKKQLICMVVGTMIPTTVEILKAVSTDMLQTLPPTAVTLAVTCIIIFWSIFRYQLFSIIPVAQDKIMDSIHEGIMTE